MFHIRKIGPRVGRAILLLCCVAMVTGQGARAQSTLDQVAPSAPIALLHCSGAVAALAFSPDGRLLAVGIGTSPDVQVWDTGPWRLRHSLKQQIALGGGRTGCGALTFLPNGRLATASDNVTGPTSAPYAEVRVWNPKTGFLQQTLTFGQVKYGFCPPALTGLAASPDGLTLLGAAAPAKDLICWDVRTKATTLIPTAPFALDQGDDSAGAFGAVAFSPDGRAFAARYHEQPFTGTFSPSGYLLVWNGITRSPQRSWPFPNTDTDGPLAYAPGGASLAMTILPSRPGSMHAEGLGYCTLNLNDGRTGEPRGQIPLPGQWPTCFAYDPTTGALAIGTSGGAVLGITSGGVTRGGDASLIPILPGGANAVRALAVSRGGLLAVGYEDGTVRVWRRANDGKWGLRPTTNTQEASAPGQAIAGNEPPSGPHPVLVRIDPASFNYLFPADNPPSITLHVSGSGFAPGAVVQWGGLPLPTKYLSSTDLEATLATDHAVTQPGIKGLPSDPLVSSNGPDQVEAMPVTVLDPDGGTSRLAVFLWTRSIVGG